MEEIPESLQLALSALRAKAMDHGFSEPFVTLIRQDGSPPAYHTKLLPGSGLHAGVTSLVTGCSLVPLQLLNISEL